MAKKQKNSDKKILIYFGVSFVIALVFIGWLLNSMEREAEEQEFFEEYNQTNVAIISLVEEHDIIIEEIREKNTIGIMNNELDSLMRNYVKWVDENLDELYDFQFFIENNHQKILDLGENPNYRRDNIKEVINLMRQNSQSFQESILNYEWTKQWDNYLDFDNLN